MDKLIITLLMDETLKTIIIDLIKSADHLCDDGSHLSELVNKTIEEIEAELGNREAMNKN